MATDLSEQKELSELEMELSSSLADSKITVLFWASPSSPYESTGFGFTDFCSKIN